MKFFIAIILTALLSFVACFYLPWWSIAITSFLIAALIPQRPLRSFFSGFSAVFILWLGLSLWISSANGHLLAHKVSLIIIKMDNLAILVLLTAFVGALVAGLGALTGAFVRSKPAAA